MKLYKGYNGKIIKSSLSGNLYAIKDASNYIISETGMILITEDGKRIIKE